MLIDRGRVIAGQRLGENNGEEREENEKHEEKSVVMVS